MKLQEAMTHTEHKLAYRQKNSSCYILSYITLPHIYTHCKQAHIHIHTNCK